MKNTSTSYGRKDGCSNKWLQLGEEQNLFSHNSGCQKSELSFPGLKSRCWQGYTFSGGSRGESVPCFFWLLVVAGNPCAVVALLQSLPPSSHCLLLFFLFLSLIRISVMAFRAHLVPFPSVQFSSVAQSCLTLCDPMNCSTLGLPVHHQLLEFTQTHVHWVGDAIQPSHVLLSRSPPAFNLSQHQGLFQWVSSSHPGQSIGVSASTSVLPMNIQDWFPLGWTGLISLKSKGLSRIFSKHHSSKVSVLWRSAFFIVQLSHPYMTTA